MQADTQTAPVPEATKDQPSKDRAFLTIQGCLIGILLLVLVPILFLQGYFFYERYQYRRGIELQANLEIARAVGRTFSIFVHSVLSQELSIGTSLTLRDDLTVEQMNRILGENKAEFPSVRNFSWLDLKGRIIASSLVAAVGLEVTSKAYLTGAISGRDWVLSDLYLSAISGEPIFGISRSVRDTEGTLVGIVLAAVDVALLDDLFAFEREKGGGFGIVDSKGMLVYRHPKLKNLTWEKRNLVPARPFLPRVLAGEEVASTILAEHEGRRRLSSWVPIKSIGWAAGAGKPEDEIIGPIRSDIFKSIGSTLLVALVSFAVAFAFLRYIADSISALRDRVLSFGRGQYHGSIKMSGPEELLDLARAFSGMAKDIEDRDRERAEHLSLIEAEIEWRREVEERVAAAHREIQSIIDNTPAFVYAFDLEERFVLVNTALAELLRSTPEQMIGKRRHEFMPKEDADWHEANDRQVIEAGRALELEEYSQLKGRSMTWLTTKFPIRDTQGRIYAVAGISVDISERKQMEAELRRSHDELEQRVRERTADLQKANEELRSLPSRLITAQEEERKRLASELHDSIGQTLAALKFNVELVLHARKHGSADHALEMLDRFVPTLQRSIEETRSIYMGLRPRMLEERGVIDTLNWFCREFVRLYPKHHVEPDLRMEEKDIPEDLKVVIFRIAQESLNNVAKHSNAEWVNLSLLRTGSGIELFIEDNGVGMDLQYIQAHAATAKSLGLTSMRERAEFTGGTFSIESAIGVGTTVRVQWPANEVEK